jgi:predicted esterase
MKCSIIIVIVTFCLIGSSSGEISDPETLPALSEKLFNSYELHPGEIAQEAVLAYQEADYEKAAEYYILALMADLDDNPVTLFNLACCYGLLDEPELAGKALLQAARSGFDRPELIETDPDFSLVRDSEEFNEYLDDVMMIIDEAEELQSTVVLGERLYLEFPVMQTVRVHLPENYDPQQEYDLILALHGYGGDVAEFSSRWTAFDNGNFIFASLQAPYSFTQGDRAVYSWTLHGSSEWETGDMPPEQKQALFSSSTDLSSELIVACTDALKESYSIDGVYLLGFSQGGIMAYWTGLRNPSIFRGIATFSGVIDEELYTHNVFEASNSIPVFIGRGTLEDDRAVNARDILLSEGFSVTFFEYEGGHFIPDEGLRAVEDWMWEIEQQ